LTIFLVSAVVILSPIFVNELFPQFQEGIFSLQILAFSLFPLFPKNRDSY